MSTAATVVSFSPTEFVPLALGFFGLGTDYLIYGPEELSGDTVTHAYLGVATSGSSTGTPGATLAQVTAGGPAADAGLRTGDVVTKLGDAKVQNANDLVAAIAAHRPGDSVAVTVERGSNTVNLTVTLGTQPAQSSSGG